MEKEPMYRVSNCVKQKMTAIIIDVFQREFNYILSYILTLSFEYIFKGFILLLLGITAETLWYNFPLNALIDKSDFDLGKAVDVW